MPDPATTPVPITEPTGTSARYRLNLIEQISRDAVATDYAIAPADRRPRPGARKQRVLVAATALGLAGFVLALGVSARLINTPVVSSQRQALIERIDAVDAEHSGLVAEVAVLRAEQDRAREESLAASLAGRALEERITDLAAVTGYVAVQGPGAVVTLTDAAAEEPPLGTDGGQAELERVLDSDVQLTVNGLWTAGAEAISVNGQRLTAQSAIRSAAGAILVNYRPLKPPYVVSAIGPRDLAERFAETEDAARLQALSQQFGIGWDVSSADELTLRPATTPLPSQATVVAEDEGAVP